jgi:hypothetical protein
MLGPVLHSLRAVISVRLHLARFNRLRMWLRRRNRGLSIARRHACDESIRNARADRRADTRRGVPASAGRKSGNKDWVIGRVELKRRVVAGRDVVK